MVESTKYSWRVLVSAHFAGAAWVAGMVYMGKFNVIFTSVSFMFNRKIAIMESIIEVFTFPLVSGAFYSAILFPWSLPVPSRFNIVIVYVTLTIFSIVFAAAMILGQVAECVIVSIVIGLFIKRWIRKKSPDILEVIKKRPNVLNV